MESAVFFHACLEAKIVIHIHVCISFRKTKIFSLSLSTSLTAFSNYYKTGMGRRRRFAFSGNWKRWRRWRAASPYQQALDMWHFIGQALDILASFMIFFKSQFLDHMWSIIPNTYSIRNFSNWFRYEVFSGKKPNFFEENLQIFLFRPQTSVKLRQVYQFRARLIYDAC